MSHSSPPQHLGLGAGEEGWSGNRSPCKAGRDEAMAQTVSEIGGHFKWCHILHSRKYYRGVFDMVFPEKLCRLFVCSSSVRGGLRQLADRG